MLTGGSTATEAAIDFRRGYLFPEKHKMPGLMSSAKTARSELAAAVSTCRSAFLGIALMTGVLNVLYLTGSFFMLEIYDRVLPSRSIPTLVGLAVLAVVLYAFQGILDVVRGRVLVRIGAS